MNSSGGAGQGYFNSEYAPFRVLPATTGIKNTTNAAGQARFESRYDFLHQIDDPLRVNSPYGTDLEDYDAFYRAAQGMMYNPTVNKAFQFTTAESTRYGATAFGNACLVARQVLNSHQGTRFIQITQGGWDNHNTIYQQNVLPNNLALLDNGLGTLIADMKADGSLANTLIVMLGEFGRTVGPLSAAGGRDHYAQQFAFFAGGGIKGGRAIGSTTANGASTLDPGWSRQRDVKPEDIEATIYSAMGIDWTTIRHDDPLGRGFYYVPIPTRTFTDPSTNSGDSKLVCMPALTWDQTDSIALALNEKFPELHPTHIPIPTYISGSLNSPISVTTHRPRRKASSKPSDGVARRISGQSVSRVVSYGIRKQPCPS